MQSVLKVTNTALDPSKAMLHRRAFKMEMEPTIAGRRLRLRSSMLLNELQAEVNKEYLKFLEGQGVVSVTKIVPETFANAQTELKVEGDTVETVVVKSVEGVSSEPNRGGDMFPEKTPEIMSPPKLGTFPGMEKGQNKGQQQKKR